MASGKTVLEASDANLAPISGTREAVVAALSKSARGAPAFDRQGALVAFVAPISAEPKRLGGVVLAEPHELVGARRGRGPRDVGERGAGASGADGRGRHRAQDARRDHRGFLHAMNHGMEYAF